MFATTHVLAGNSMDWLETVPPGHELAAALAQIDVSDLSDFDQVTVMAAHNRLVSHYQAKVCADISSLETKMRLDQQAHHYAVEHVGVEVGAALQLTRRTAEAETHLALELVRRLPEAHRALLRGDIDLRRAKAMVRAPNISPTTLRGG